MSNHPYVRAYLAGIAAPTVFLLFVSTGFAVARFGLDVSMPIERAVAFPMAVVPNLWGLWNMLYVRLNRRRWVSIGTHGALLPMLLVPLALALAAAVLPPMRVPVLFTASLFAVAVIVYYLVWQFVVGFLNEELGIA